VSRAAAALPWLVATIGAAASYALFAPGYVSFDSVVQFHEAMSGRYSNQHPPLMAILWRFTHALLPGGAGLLAAQMLAWWTGVALLARALRRGPWMESLVVLALGAFPALLGLIGHLWKDALMLALLMLATGAAAWGVAHARRGALLAAILVLVAAACIRHNAVLIVLPIAAWIGWQLVARLPARALVTTSIVVVAFAIPAAIERRPDVQRTQLWPLTAVWDIVAISIANDRLLLPPQVHAPGLSVTALAADFSPWTCLPTLVNHPVKSSVVVPYTDDEASALRTAWLEAIVAHPQAWLVHRGTYVAFQLGLRRDGVPPHAVLGLTDRDLPGHPAAPLAAWQQSTLDWLAAQRDGWMFRPWVYYLASLPLAVLAWRRRERPAARLALAVAAGGWLTLAALAVLSASAEFRYLAWGVACPLLMAVLLIARDADSGNRQVPVSTRAR
jgi:hypothetical protein